MIKRKLAKFGNGTYVLLDKAVLQMLGLGYGDEVQLHIENNKIVVSSVKNKNREIK